MRLPLRGDETVVLELRPHWSALLRPALAAVVMVAAAVAAGLLWSPGRGGDAVDAAGGVVAAFFVMRLAAAELRRRTTSVVLTDRRLISTRGVLGRSVTVVPLTRIGGVEVRRTAGGRLLGYGTIVLTPPFGEGESVLERIPRPRRFQRRLLELLGDAWPAPEERPGRAEEEDTGPLPRVIV